MARLSIGVAAAVPPFGTRKGSDQTLLLHVGVSSITFVVEVENYLCRILKNHRLSCPNCFRMMVIAAARNSFAR